MVPTILAHLARKRLSASPPTGAAPKEQHSAKFKALYSKPGHLSDAPVVPSPALNVANPSEDTQVYPPQPVGLVSTDVASAGVNLHQASIHSFTFRGPGFTTRKSPRNPWSFCTGLDLPLQAVQST